MSWSNTQFIQQVSVHKVWFASDITSDWVVMKLCKLLNILVITFLRRELEASHNLCGLEIDKKKSGNRTGIED